MSELRTKAHKARRAFQLYKNTVSAFAQGRATRDEVEFRRRSLHHDLMDNLEATLALVGEPDAR